MKNFAFQKLDAFTDGSSEGNPAGFVDLTDGSAITEQEMQRIAYELKGFVSEVGYAQLTDKADLALRYFSCEKEVPFCGHATVAVMHRLLSCSPALASQSELRIFTRKGVLKVINRIQEENRVYIYAPEPVFLKTTLTHAAVAEALNLPLEALDAGAPLALVNVGQDALLVPLVNKESNVQCSPDYTKLRAFALNNGFEILNIYTTDTYDQANTLRTRVFAPAFGYLEDPATGSGNAALGYHLHREGKWRGTPISIEQGPEPQRPNQVFLERKEGRMLIGGQAVCRISGQYSLL